MVTRTLTNTGDPISGVDNQPLSGVVITFQLVDEAKKQPVTLFDAAGGGGELIIGNLVTAVTDAAGQFSVDLWPNNRGEIATLYKVRLPGGIAGSAGAAASPAKPFYIRVVEGEGDLLLLAAKTAMEALQPQTLSLFDALLANIISFLGNVGAGQYEPAIIQANNVTVMDNAGAKWSRIQNMVTVSGHLYLNWSGNGDMVLSLPFGFSPDTQNLGQAVIVTSSNLPAVVMPVQAITFGGTTPAATFALTEGNGGAAFVYYSFSYQVA